MKKKDAELLALEKWPKITDVRKLTMTMNETFELQRRAFVKGLMYHQEKYEQLFCKYCGDTKDDLPCFCESYIKANVK